MINFLKKHLPPRVKRFIKKLIKKRPNSCSKQISVPKSSSTEKQKQVITFAPELTKNMRFVDSHKGEECFILGNGPSLKRVDLEKLQDKFVITCNMFTKVNDYKKARSNIHIVVDNIFFEKYDEYSIEKNNLNEMWNKICGMKVPVFVPLSVKDFIVENGLDKKTDIYYLDIIRSHLPDRSGRPLKVDFTKPINSYTNVVQFGIVVAINMGFTKINLLGCDGTVIYSILNAAADNQEIEAHAYDNDDSKQKFENQIKKIKLGSALYWESFSYLGFERLNDLCEQKAIQLLNLTDKTLIDGVPKGNGAMFYK